MDVTPARSLLPEQVRAVLALADRAEAHDGVAPLGEAARLALTHPGPAVHLLTGSGYAQLDPGTASAELVVDPAARRRGRGRALLDAVLDRAPDAAVWAHGDLPAARALAASAGLVEVRRLAVLARPVGPDDVAPPTPAGLVLAPLRPGRDERAWLAVNAAAFADHPEQGRITAADLAERMAQPWFDPEDLLLAWRDGELAGSVWVKVEDPASGDGELYVVGVAPEAQGTGLGSWLTRVALARVAAHGARRCVLYVDQADRRALGVYERAGFSPLRHHVQYARA